MGVILAKFRKQKTTYQILEKLEEDIKEAEALTISTKEKQRRFIVNLYLVSIGLLVIGCLLYYFYFLPPTWSKRIVYATPLLVASVLVICLGRLGSWFFQKRLNKNSSNLTKLREEKKKIIEKVMDTETYKVAIDLLNRFGDKTNGLRVQSNIGGMVSLEEYEYSAFRCAFCKVLNPAKKIRPKAPAIENIGSTVQSSSSTSSSDRDSGSEADEKGKSPVTASLSTGDVSNEQDKQRESETSVEPPVDEDNVQPSQSDEDKLDENVEEKSAIDKKTD